MLNLGRIVSVGGSSLLCFGIFVGALFRVEVGFGVGSVGGLRAALFRAESLGEQTVEPELVEIRIHFILAVFSFKGFGLIRSVRLGVSLGHFIGSEIVGAGNQRFVGSKSGADTAAGFLVANDDLREIGEDGDLAGEGVVGSGALDFA